MQAVAPAGRQPVVVAGAGGEIVVGVAQVVQYQAHDRQRQQRSETEIVQQHRQQDHVSQQDRLQRMEAVGGKRRGRQRPVVLRVEAAQRAGVQQPMVGVEVDVVPDQQYRHFREDPQRSGILRQSRPAPMQERPGQDRAEAEDQDRQRGEREFVTDLAVAQRFVVESAAPLQGRQQTPGQQPGAAAQDEIDAGEERQTPAHRGPRRGCCETVADFHEELADTHRRSPGIRSQTSESPSSRHSREGAPGDSAFFPVIPAKARTHFLLCFRRQDQDGSQLSLG